MRRVELRVLGGGVELLRLGADHVGASLHAR